MPSVTGNIEDLSPRVFEESFKLDLTYGARRDQVEHFVITQIGQIHYAVSIDFGYSYTRPQLIRKYTNVGATFLSVPRNPHS